jgi:general secretion pathway protein J
MNRHAGFTLLEMMVALVVFGLLMAGIAQTMRYGMAAWSAETRAADGPETMAAVDGALRRLIEQALPDDFTGQPDQMAFTTDLPAGSLLADPLGDAALLVTPDRQLALRWQPHPAGIPLRPAAAPRTEILLPGVASLQAQYLTVQDDGALVWSNRWSGAGLPVLVRIHLAFADRRRWPDIVVAPAGATP